MTILNLLFFFLYINTVITLHRRDMILFIINCITYNTLHTIFYIQKKTLIDIFPEYINIHYSPGCSTFVKACMSLSYFLFALLDSCQE